MATEFLMPKLGLTMEEGTILQWLVDDGAEVEPGAAVMLIETDKVESEVEVNGAGRLHRIGAEGQTFRCGETVGFLLAVGESAPQPVAPSLAVSTAEAAPLSPAATAMVAVDAPAPAVSVDGQRAFVSPNARRIAAERRIDLSLISGTGPGGRIVSEDLADAPRRTAACTAQPQPLSQSASSQSSVPATAAARQLSDLLGVDLTVVPPDPVDGYVTREAVARYVRARLRSTADLSPAGRADPPAAAQPSVAPATAAAPAPPATQTPTSAQRMSAMRATIAKRMFASLHEMAQLTLTMDADMDAVVADREHRSANSAAPSYTDYVIAAVARALRQHPGVNTQVTPEGIAHLPDIHVGMAVALDDGLMVPVVRHADRLSIAELAATTARLAGAARQGCLTLQELEGGTFSVSTLGMFGVDAFTPVINPPNVAILGVGRIRDDLVLLDGAVSTTKRMTLSLTWDHRVLDGAPAARFCKTIVELLNEPSHFD